MSSITEKSRILINSVQKYAEPLEISFDGYAFWFIAAKLNVVHAHMNGSFAWLLEKRYRQTFINIEGQKMPVCA